MNIEQSYRIRQLNDNQRIISHSSLMTSWFTCAVLSAIVDLIIFTVPVSKWSEIIRIDDPNYYDSDHSWKLKLVFFFSQEQKSSLKNVIEIRPQLFELFHWLADKHILSGRTDRQIDRRNRITSVAGSLMEELFEAMTSRFYQWNLFYNKL